MGIAFWVAESEQAEVTTLPAVGAGSCLHASAEVARAADSSQPMEALGPPPHSSRKRIKRTRLLNPVRAVAAFYGWRTYFEQAEVAKRRGDNGTKVKLMSLL